MCLAGAAGRECAMADITQNDIRQTALAQSAIDCHCTSADFTTGQNKVVVSQRDPRARKYLELPFLCHFVSYGNNIVASASEPFLSVAAWYIATFPVAHCFETPHLHALNQALQPLSAAVCFMAEYWLPDVSRLVPQPCAYELRPLTPADFSAFDLYRPEWSNALCKERKELDVFAIGAYNGQQLIGLAGCSADCDTMLQIGVDVLPAYRRQGIASALTSALALAALERGKVPFYCCAWSNLPSARNAIHSGFVPAWVEMTVKSSDEVAKWNTEDQTRQGKATE